MIDQSLRVPMGVQADASRLHLAERHVHAALYLGVATGVLSLQPIPMDACEVGILAGALAVAMTLARRATPLSRLLLAALTIAGLCCWGQSRAAASGSTSHALAFLESSQAQIFLMGIVTWLASAVGLAGWWTGVERARRAAARSTVAATLLGLTALFVRWYESYHIGGRIGHIPISNLYEVLVLFVIIAGAIQMTLARKPAISALNAFISPAASVAVGFLFWYGSARQAGELQPLVPALDSYWMKLHVPANFIGYGSFCAAAMLALAWLMAGSPVIARRLPSRDVIDELMYKLIAVGFVFFTLATVLGALWAAEAWGSYWSWDPKETWALIVWLNYGAWLHLRLIKGSRGRLTAWWALIGLLVTLFAFLGVNIYLSGLHSYGSL